MKRVSVPELRQNLSALLRCVRDGEAFEVMDRGRPIALLVPLPPGGDPIAGLERRGQIARLGGGMPIGLPTLRTPRSTEEVLGELREEKI